MARPGRARSSKSAGAEAVNHSIFFPGEVHDGERKPSLF
jgi:hypothetical protein